MKRVNLVLIIITNTYFCLGQTTRNYQKTNIKNKAALDANSFKNWPHIISASITNNGKFCAYIQEEKFDREQKVILRSTKKDWIFESTISGPLFFSDNSRYAIWINTNDSLCIAKLGNNNVKYISEIQFFNIEKRFVLFQTKENNIKEFKLGTNKVYVYPLKGSYNIIANYKKSLLIFNPQDPKLILLNRNNKQNITEIWTGSGIRSLAKDNKMEHFIFLTGIPKDTLWYYKMGWNFALQLPYIAQSNNSLVDLSHFSENGKNVFIESKEEKTTSNKQRTSILNLWSYLDRKLPSQESKEIKSTNLVGLLEMSDYRFQKLGSTDDLLLFPSKKDTIVLIRQQKETTPKDEVNWDKDIIYTWSLKSLNNERQINLEKIDKGAVVQLSPYGKYVLYYDKNYKSYFIYETSTGNNRNITHGIVETWENKNNPTRRNIAAWEVDDKNVYINGEYDIWQIDPTGLNPPLNLTNNYGRKHSIIFSLALEEYSHRCLVENEQLILSAFNLRTKENGFYIKKYRTTNDPDSLTMGPYIYDIQDNQNISYQTGYSPIKARNSNKYIVQRMSSTEAPNFFLTKNFKSFEAISNLHPEKLFNWYKTELHTWISQNGLEIQGILYKPEDFDSLKSYPVILHYYDKKSDGLNAYLQPRPLEGGCAINIPYYVSNGYLVFCPDIQYPLGDPMEGTYNAVISAANYLSGLKYVDSSRLGIQGCSWGGIQTNYLVANSKKFAAACSASSIANWVSSYGSIKGSGETMQSMYEAGQFRVSATLWQRPEIYIKNSAMFYADQISTPLLLMHTIQDEICTLPNILQFYTSLRRLGKRSWLLLYEGNHALGGNDEMDFSFRMKQFFDHYLLHTAAPKWMTQPMLISTQGLKSSMELDSTNLTPGAGLNKYPL